MIAVPPMIAVPLMTALAPVPPMAVVLSRRSMIRVTGVTGPA